VHVNTKKIVKYKLRAKVTLEQPRSVQKFQIKF